MSEQALWRRMRRELRGRGHWVRVENGAETGTPDVNYCVDGAEGWIELKHLYGWPTRSATVVQSKLEHDQAIWLTERRAHGGRAWVLCAVERELLLFDGVHALALEEGRDRLWWIERAAGAWDGPVDWESFLTLLMER